MTTTRTTTLPLGCALLAGVALAGCNEKTDPGMEDLSGVPAFAVHRSDFTSAAVALLDGDGALLDDRYLSSGSEVPGLNAPLHGDIALPTTPCETGVLVVVARLGGDYVIEVDLEHNEVMRQVPTQESDLEDEAAYRANPYDVLCVDDDVAFVPRFEPNLAASEDDIDQGDDVAVIDMRAKEITSRIDLSAARTMVEGEVAYARPSSIVRTGAFAVVGLGRLTDGWVAAPGMVALVDLEARELHDTFEIEGLKNCGTVVPVAGRDDAVLVQCSGSPFGDVASAGIALLRVSDDGEVTEEAALRNDETPALFNNVVSLGGTRVVAVALGDYDEGTPDEAFVVDLDSGDREALFATEEPGTIGSGAYRAETGLLLVPDAELGVRLFDVGDDAVEALDEIELDEALPARTVRAIRP